MKRNSTVGNVGDHKRTLRAAESEMNIVKFEALRLRCCPDCGENLEGDGYTRTLHCPYTELETNLEPDANPVYCGLKSEVTK